MVREHDDSNSSRDQLIYKQCTEEQDSRNRQITEYLTQPASVAKGLVKRDDGDNVSYGISRSSTESDSSDSDPMDWTPAL